MKKLVIGILAHVDAGKTTLSESMLYLSGKIRKLGRVDNKDAFLDTYELEKARGITIFSKQALLNIEDTEITLLDTPGHVDFSAEMERTLQVLDYAILVISGADGVQGHTKTLWQLLESYHIPVFIFINKMDQNGTEQKQLLVEIKKQLSESCISFEEDGTEEFLEQIALCDEHLMESYLKNGKSDAQQINHAIKTRKIFPCFFGSALKLQGIDNFMKHLSNLTMCENYPDQFSAKIFKITRDEQGNRLTHMKITGGNLKVKDSNFLSAFDEKINQIRIYSGEKYEAVNEVVAGTICAVVGPTKTRAGEVLGSEAAAFKPILEPILSYRIMLPDGYDPRVILPKLHQLEEELPEFRFHWQEELKEIQTQIMGEVQLEILQSLIKLRFGVDINFDAGHIVYKETINDRVEGVGHFEPLRHYAEVHLLLEPSEQGSGLIFELNCSEDELSKNWQRLILTHLEEKSHRGVLTGSAITDMKITLVKGKAHNKHTEGGDFREATYRAIRQGLMQADSRLLEPYYHYRLELPEKMVGRAMTDVEKMMGTCEISHIDGEITVLKGIAPVASMKNYQKEVIAYTRGEGRFFATLMGYGPCHNSDEVVKQMAYDPERDYENPASSVFCTHGTGLIVPWDQVHQHMHLERYLKATKLTSTNVSKQESESLKNEIKWMSIEEINAIINDTAFANQGRKSQWKKSKSTVENYSETTRFIGKQNESKVEYLLVDGYNIIFSWPELKSLSEDNLDSARAKLLDILSNYQPLRRSEIIVVFDAYKVEGRREEIINYQNIHVVFTSEAQTADLYIEKFAHQNQMKYHIVVATSDGLQQMIIRGAGAGLLSARELKEAIETAAENLRTTTVQLNENKPTSLEETLTYEERIQIEELIKKNESNH
ncbi:NYN domain-containing protein [Fusibacter bizertensis]